MSSLIEVSFIDIKPSLFTPSSYYIACHKAVMADLFVVAGSNLTVMRDHRVAEHSAFYRLASSLYLYVSGVPFVSISSGRRAVAGRDSSADFVGFLRVGGTGVPNLTA
jgi:hypothetical protein